MCNRSDVIRILGGWEGYEVATVARFEPGEDRPKPVVWIYLKALPNRRMRCSGCGRFVSKVHEYCGRWIRDLPLLDAETWLLVQRCRVACDRCGPKLEWLPWLGRYERVTKRFAESVARLCEVLPIKHVAQYFHLDWKTVKAIDKRYLEGKLGPVDLSGVEVIAIDEFSIRKGHRYATIVADPYTRRVLWVGPGRRREDVRPFFELLGEDGRRRLKAVVMDMDAAYEPEVRDQCPGAEIVYDEFHVIAKYGREVIDRVRVDEANRLKHDRPARRVVKGSKWLLLRNPNNIRSHQDRVRLRELLKVNRKLMAVYVLKEDLKHLWDYIYPRSALKFWTDWYNRAIRSRIAPLKSFARKLKERIHGILAHCRWPMNTSFLEGINNKVKVIKRMAYGFRDLDYFFLKIRAAFPGNRR